ncbi:unnamed protein product [Paramecium primaurelia]|uniref:Transmembrane protein n=1 Tax=Paramecium primaurelia TaxID=5886 RepID=A0A8S1JNF4_PARPR|nr:unnamed protein product [Paramecium primaurelia]
MKINTIWDIYYWIDRSIFSSAFLSTFNLKKEKLFIEYQNTLIILQSYQMLLIDTQKIINSMFYLHSSTFIFLCKVLQSQDLYFQVYYLDDCLVQYQHFYWFVCVLQLVLVYVMDNPIHQQDDQCLIGFQNQIVNFNKKIHKNRDNLFFCMLFLRLTPLIPNVSINVSGPIVGLPFKYFFFGTLFGLMLGNTIHIRTGLLIQELNDFSTSFIDSNRIVFSCSFTNIIQKEIIRIR